MKKDVSKFEFAFNLLVGLIATISGLTLINLMFIEFGAYKSLLAVCTWVLPMNIAIVLPVLIVFKTYITETLK
jgi:uncharacterized membrane protein